MTRHAAEGGEAFPRGKVVRRKPGRMMDGVRLEMVLFLESVYIF